MNFQEFSEQCLIRFYADAVPKSSACAHRIFNEHVYPIFGHMELADIRKSQIMAAAEQWQEWSTYYTKRILQLLVRIFDYAEIMELVDRNPADRVQNFVQPHKTRGYKFVGPRQLPTLFAAVQEHSESSQTVQNAFWLLVYSALRRQEVIYAQWGEIDTSSQIWTIPAERMKKRRDHVVPITSQMMDLLEQQRGLHPVWVFPAGWQKNADRPICDWAPYQCLRKAGWQDRQTLHGFRKVFSTHAHQSGLWSVDAIELQIAHLIPGVRGVYNHADMLEERERMMQWYCDQVDRWRGSMA